MTIYARPDELVFAENANPGEVVAFPDIPRGWGLAFEQTEGKPPMEWFNDILRRQDRAIRYLLQRGLSEWSETENYPAGAYVQRSDITYRSLLANTDVEPGTSAVTWVPWGLEIATTVEAQALMNDMRALTPKKLADAFEGANQSLGNTGFQRLPGGLIIQWGRADMGSGTSLQITYPLAFPNAAFSITFGDIANDEVSVCSFAAGTTGNLLTGFMAVGSPANRVPGGFTWMAIGR